MFEQDKMKLTRRSHKSSLPAVDQDELTGSSLPEASGDNSSSRSRRGCGMRCCYLLLVVIMILAAQIAMIQLDQETEQDCIEMISSKGYPVEVHYVTTSDGYILALHRILPVAHGTSQSAASAVLLVHPLLGSSADWVINGANQSLGFLLADAGFDVWLANVRGNTYSRNHTSLSPETSSFWNFSFNEIVKYDLPAMIDHVVSVTGQAQLYYIGHSQGTAMGFAGFSSNHTLGAMVKRFYALAPITISHHITGGMKLFSDSYKLASLFFNFNNSHEFSPVSTIHNKIGRRLCAHSLVALLCRTALFLCTGPNIEDFNTTRIPVYLSHMPAGTSGINMAYWGQVAWTGKFLLYDYGSLQLNINHYGQPIPPAYNISDISVPTVLFTGGNDWLSSAKDISILLPKIRHVVQHMKTIPHYQHLDFLWALTAHSTVYSHIIEDIKKQI